MSVKIKLNKRALDKAIKEAAESAAYDATYDIECPHCGKPVNVPPGISACPHCGNKIDLNLDIKF